MLVKGMLTLDELKKKVASEEIETVITAFTDHYGRMMGKRYDAEFFLESVVKSGTHACNYLLTTDMEMEPVPGYDFANWELGYGDFHLVPDMKTLRVASWLESTALVVCDVYSDKTHELIPEAPRSLLSGQIKQLKVRGFDSAAATELEYYLFENDYRSAHEAGYSQMTPAGWYLEDYHIMQGTRTEEFTAAARRHLKHSGVPVENSKGEWGLGQHELNVQYAESLEMADRHIVYKQCLKELADAMGISVTFMAKFHEDRAGSSSHVHISLWKDGKNLFVGDEDFGPVKASKEFGHFLAGWIKYVPDMMVFYAPTINSYKRFVDGSWAPTRMAWSKDNRTAGFRIVGEGNSLRIECRIPGADCNPYLTLAASIASGLKGMKEKLTPEKCFEGDIYAAAHLPGVPRTLKEAVSLFRESAFAKEAFGEEVVKHYAHFYETEVADHEKAVSDWERKRYFERI
ncbi:MAG: glutamine synthetase family protein [Imperialibacter sp.]|uniref:glutamine synthetase family protein n=1 Tax=Imperialibacter sp. TaxID=2038411 RepID=UPI0032EB474B